MPFAVSNQRLIQNLNSQGWHTLLLSAFTKFYTVPSPSRPIKVDSIHAFVYSSIGSTKAETFDCKKIMKAVS